MVNKLRNLEEEMWSAFSVGDVNKFKKFVSDDALMICGGYRESGYGYSQVVAEVRLDRYKINDFEAKQLGDDLYLTHYIVEVVCPDSTLSGTFRVSSVWKRMEEGWTLVFNQDTKLF